MPGMKIVLATGIYSPDIGGPATYVRALSEELTKRGETVTVITYAKSVQPSDDPVPVMRISRSGFFLSRWMRYAKALRVHAADADIVYCFSSVSCGFPLILSRIKKPKRFLRLGGDFAWERYTDKGGKKTLREYYASYSGIFGRLLLWPVFSAFHHIVFSTAFQRDLCRKWFTSLPAHSVIENALPGATELVSHSRHDPLKFLFVGRFVRFKNLEKLVKAVARVPLATLTLVGDGPMRTKAMDLARSLQLQGRIAVLPPVYGADLFRVFKDHDVLILPSLTEISPNVALEARTAGLPVLLTEEHGLSSALSQGMWVRPLQSVTEITKAILEIDHGYEQAAAEAGKPLTVTRGWEEVTQEHLRLFHAREAA